MKKALLLGAGFSYDFGMPLASELTDIFLAMFDKQKAKRLASLLSENRPYTDDRPINKRAILEGMELLLEYKKNGGRNYEELLSNLEKLAVTHQKTQSDKDSYSYLLSIFYKIIYEILTIYQFKSYDTLYPRNMQWFSKFENLLSEDETWVFTLNHDLYMECLALDFGIPITYGDTGEIFFPMSNLKMNEKILFSYSERHNMIVAKESYFKSQKGINLVKIHGGLSEFEYKDSRLVCNLLLDKENSASLISDYKMMSQMAYYHQGFPVPSGKDRVITNSDGELDIIRMSMLTGGNKYSKTTKVKEGEEKLKIFADVLATLDELTIIGYGFADPHVNYRVLNAMVLNGKLRIRIVDPVNKPKPEFLQQFDYDSRIRGALCGAPLWMDYSVTEKWNQDQMTALKENEKLRAEIKQKIEFDVRAVRFHN